MWLNNKKYSMEEWAEKVGMDMFDLYDMKIKLGLPTS